jgi:ABC-type uncharacterized transport system substrate-binding protein
MKKRIGLGLILMGLAGLAFWISYGKMRRTAAVPAGNPTARLWRVAVLQHVSHSVLDDAVNGLVDALAEKGWVDGQTIALRKFNAEGDLAVAGAIAKELTDGKFALILTASTPSLQAVATANRTGKVNHVFVAVTDPYGAGVGIDRTNHLDHPPCLAGCGTMPPVEECFQLARQLRPELKSVGVVWNPAEANSEAQVKLARAACQKLGIALLEANSENSAGVYEAASTLVGRGVEALWIDGDTTVMTASESVMQAAKKGKIPVFSVIPSSIERGALFDLGANYYTVGKWGGQLAAEILAGRQPATFPVENVVSNRLFLNPLALRGLKESWQLPPAIRQRAELIIDETGKHKPASEPTVLGRPSADRPFKIGIVYFEPNPGIDSCLEGLGNGLSELGFVEGKNLVIRRAHAQGETANIRALLQNFDSPDVDLIIPMSTPCVAAACGLVKKTPVVFTYCEDPIAAGVGQSFSEHLPLVTGIGSFPPVGGTVELIKKILPNTKTVGTLYNGSEANSRGVAEVARGLFAKRGIRLVEATVADTNEVAQAAAALASREIHALWIAGDLTSRQAFDGILKVANQAHLPIITNDPECLERGALACVGIDFYASGRATAKLAARVLLGEKPADIPVENVAVLIEKINPAVARRLGNELKIEAARNLAAITNNARKVAATAPPSPPRSSAERKTTPLSPSKTAVTPAVLPRPPAGRVFKLAIVTGEPVPANDACLQGFFAGLQDYGFVEGKNLTVQKTVAGPGPTNASACFKALDQQGLDLIVPLTTPCVAAACGQVQKTPVVFAHCPDAVAAGAGTSLTDHLPQVTGIVSFPPVSDTSRIIKSILPKIKSVGLLYAGTDLLSRQAVEAGRDACARRGIKIEEGILSDPDAVRPTVRALMDKGVQALWIFSDSTALRSFAAIAQVAGEARLPILVNDPQYVERGALAAVGIHHYPSGRAAARSAARVLLGEKPQNIPLENVAVKILKLNREVATMLGLDISPDLSREETPSQKAPP